MYRKGKALMLRSPRAALAAAGVSKHGGRAILRDAAYGRSSG